MDVSLGQEIPLGKAAALFRIPLAGRPVLTGQTGICWKKKRRWKRSRSANATSDPVRLKLLEGSEGEENGDGE